MEHGAPFETEQALNSAPGWLTFDIALKHFCYWRNAFRSKAVGENRVRFSLGP